MELRNLLPIFVSFLVYFPVAPAQECGTNGSFVTHSKYDTNRGILLSSLASNVSAQGGFYNASVGQGLDRVYALGMCIQGANRAVCSNCIDLASKSILEKCPNQTEGLAWPENEILCMVRYSNRPFFGSLELEPRYILYNNGEIRSNLTNFNKSWEDLTSRMVAEATSSSSQRKYYAAEKVPLTSSQNIYALMQCTPILSLKDCSICLNESVGNYETCCHGYQGGIVYRPSCVFRWEVYPFSQAFDLTSTPPARPPTPSVDHNTNATKRGSESISAGIVVAIVVPTVIIFLVLFALACFVFRKRKSDQAVMRQGSSIEISDTNQLQFDFKTLEAATDQFSEKNVIGRGGFGEVFKAWELWRKRVPLEIVDSVIEDSYQRNEVIRCIHIALLCVQKDHAVRPGMSTIILMLTSNTITLPVPGEPGFFVKRGNNPDSSFLGSVDDASITLLEPR
ncbi:hypothetical protein Bca4012_080194 [Brassica carinata]